MVPRGLSGHRRSAVNNCGVVHIVNLRVQGLRGWGDTFRGDSPHPLVVWIVPVTVPHVPLRRVPVPDPVRDVRKLTECRRKRDPDVTKGTHPHSVRLSRVYGEGEEVNPFPRDGSFRCPVFLHLCRGSSWY